jgi:hypothetical protein
MYQSYFLLFSGENSKNHLGNVPDEYARFARLTA